MVAKLKKPLALVSCVLGLPAGRAISRQRVFVAWEINISRNNCTFELRTEESSFFKLSSSHTSIMYTTDLILL
ncbi:MAG: hypothetical protein BYD32DRAFT_407075 [Podila humilis]|nr:MAG: hypothetical protein BYD32DRAFT_407075 [Podila humilis]